MSSPHLVVMDGGAETPDPLTSKQTNDVLYWQHRALNAEMVARHENVMSLTGANEGAAKYIKKAMALTQDEGLTEQLNLALIGLKAAHQAIWGERKRA